MADYHNEFGMKSHGRKRTASMDCLDIEVKKYLLCISPDAPENPVICWLGSYTNGRFDIDDAEGPFRLDLGDVLYAPNVTRDNEVRTSNCETVVAMEFLELRFGSGCLLAEGCIS